MGHDHADRGLFEHVRRDARDGEVRRVDAALRILLDIEEADLERTHAPRELSAAEQACPFKVFI